MDLLFLRHATSVIDYHGKRLLIDPMLADVGAYDPVVNSGNEIRIPMVPLPLSEVEVQALLTTLDAVLVTHTHRDHWDLRAIELLPRQLPIFCQPEDEQVIQQAGFQTVIPITTTYDWQGIHLSRTGGKHGTGEIGARMGPVSGYVLQSEGEPTLYIAGDTIWCSDVEQALQTYQPQVVILYAGAATFVVGDPITMTAEDVATVAQTVPEAQVIAVHFETINHCCLSRAEMQKYLQQHALSERVFLPHDGEKRSF